VALPIPRFKPWQWAVLSLGGIAVLVGAYLLLRTVSPGEMVAWISELGPLPFFGSMVVLPAFGAPITPWYLLAGPAFGLEVAIPGCLIAITGNIAFTYVLARWILRPFAVRMVERAGHKVPEIRPEDRWLVTTLVRITPGPPFFMQSYLLGLAGVPFAIYMTVSVPVAALLGVPVVIFGESILEGEVAKIILGVILVVVAIVAVRLVRRILQRKEKARTAVGAGAADPAEGR